MQAIEVTNHPPDDLPQRAPGIVSSLGWAKTSDAEHVALAHLLDIPLAILDAMRARGGERATSSRANLGG